MNVILFSLYCLLSYLSLVMLNLLLCECHLVFPLLSFVILITCYVKYAPMWMSSCTFPLLNVIFCHTIITCMLCMLLCECHLLFPLLPFVILITCYVKFVPMWMSSCLFPYLLFLLSSRLSSTYLSLVMLSLLLCECHLVFPLLSFVILITCYVKFVLWMSSCFPSIVFCHTYHLLC